MSAYARVASVVNRILGRAGYRMIRLPDPPTNCRIRAMERLAIDLVLDVGANEGQYARGLRSLGYRGRIMSFEPLPDAFAVLAAAAASDPSWDVHNVAVGAAPGRLPMHVADNSVSSSLLAVTATSTEAAPESRASRTVEVAVITLAETLAAHTGARILLKIDTQGYEWQVLEGCGGALAHTLMLDIEMSLAPLYAGQALFDAVDAHVVGQGFRRIGFDPGFWNRATGELLQVDGIYVRASKAIGPNEA
jgi:FkbM family methyltransferase